MRARAWILGALALACSEPPTITSGALERPAGMIYVPRAPEPLASDGVNPNVQIERAQADLFFADSEAEGVRLMQLIHVEETNLETGAVRTVDDSDLVAGPTTFFPLAISAPGFPTELSAARLDPVDRIYALAPAGSVTNGDGVQQVGLLHLLSVPQIPFDRTRASDPRNRSMAVLPLESFLPGDFYPVDMEVLFSDATSDLVAVAFESIGPGPGMVALARVELDETGARVGRVETATVSESPRTLAWQDGRLLVSSAATATITELRIQNQSEPWLMGQRGIHVGGPSHLVIGAAALGAFVFRSDRPAAIWLELGATGFVRSAQRLRTPYTPKEEQLRPTADQAGRLDLVGIVGAAAHGVVTQMTDRLSRSVFLATDPRNDVVVLGHYDGALGFLAGSPPRVAFTVSSSVARLAPLSDDTLLVEQCQAEAPLCVPAARSLSCPGMVAVEDVQDRVFHAQYQGALVRSRFGRLTQTLGGWTLTDASSATIFENRSIQVGDRIRLQQQGTVCDLPADQVVVAEGEVLGLAPDRLQLALSGALVDPGCALDLVVYEVFPAGPEVVLTQMLGDQVLVVEERAMVETTGTGQRATFTQGALRFGISSNGTFSCGIRQKAQQPCFEESCGPGRACEFNGPDDASCATGTCGTLCAGNLCILNEEARVCSAVEILVAGTRVLREPLPSQSDRGTGQVLVYGAAPVGATFAPVRDSWFLSLAGYRGVVEVRAGGSGPIVQSQR